MSMRKPDDLMNICETMFRELQALGFSELRNTLIQTFVDEKNYVLDYDYSDATGGGISHIPYTGHPVIEKFIKDIRTANDAFAEIAITGKELEAWKEFRKTSEQIDDPRLDNVTALYYYIYSIGVGDIGISTFSSISEDKLKVLKRFRNVFDFAYRRYTDVAQAEAQAREAKIEAALERVRARTMAMQKSDELSETAVVLFQQFKELGEDPMQISIGTINETEGTVEMRITDWSGSGLQVNRAFNLSIEEPTLISKEFNAWKEHKSSIVIDLVGKDLENWIKYRNRIYGIPVRAQDIEGRRVVSCAFFSQGMLSISTQEPRSQETIQLLERFAGVFDLTYTRFLDLQKAEAQAREAQIEIALERVRSRTMAMQRSDEMADVALALFKQVKELGITAWATGFNIWQADNASYIDWITGPTGEFLEPYTVDLTRHTVFAAIREAKQRGDSFFVSELEGAQIIETYELLNSFADKGQFQKILDSGIQFPTRQFNHLVFGAQVSLLFITYEPCPEAWDIFKRFGKVFEQTYTRFLDLQKAETQAREAKIEAAVERVRAKALAMHRSEDMHAVVVTLKKELMGLKIRGVAAATIYLEQDDGSIRILDLSSLDEGEEDGSEFKMDKVFRLEDTDPDLWVRKIWSGNENYFVVEADEADFDRIVAWLYKMDEAEAAIAEKIIREKSIKKAWLPTVKLEKGKLNIDLLEPPTPEIESILLKMGAGFDLAYKRFEDLQKSEAQTREAQIELGLERVRAKAMAMQSSNELSELVDTVFKELTKLDILLDRCIIMLYDLVTNGSTWWIAAPESETLPISVFVKYHEHPPYLAYIDAWQNRTLKWRYLLEGKTKKEWDDFMFSETDMSLLPANVIKGMKSFEKIFLNASFNNFGSLTVSSFESLPDEQFDILLRFARVFELTYTRFNDLKQAEAQTREAQIELGLERVRARAMAMQKSDELAEAAKLLYHEFGKLGINTFTCGYLFIDETKNIQTAWAVFPDGTLLPDFIDFPLTGDWVMDERYRAWKEKKPLHICEIKGEENKEHHRFLSKHVPPFVVEDIFSKIPDRIIFYCANFSNGYLFILATEFFSPEDEQTIIRFAKVFEMTYTRFLDLKKAEAQAREAQIEAALERVRSSTLAMHSSEGLLSVTQVLRVQMALLGEKKLESILIHIYNKETDDFEAWYSYRNPEDPDGKIADGKAILNWSNTARARLDKQKYHSDETDYTIVADREMLTEWYKYLETVVPEVVEYDNTGNLLVPDVLYYNYSKFSGGVLLLITNSEASDSSKYLLKRSAKVFNLAYTRFIDLRKAEAQAKEAIKQASVDRVRGEIASMRSTADLEKITPLIWNELTTLGVQFMRCGVFIMDEALEQINTFLSTPDGKAIAAFHLPFTTQGTIKQILEHWYKKEIYKEFGDQAAFNQWTKNLIEQGAITSSEKYLTENRPPNFYLHFLPFLQGMFYVGSEAPLGDDEIILVKTLADAFSTAYARYEDFNKLEFAKEQIEKTLVDLKQTQIQLIQSEKMASLGELTAGIAHEIQNPLNFVNNFSEVNTELIEEMNEELKKGNLQEAVAIAANVKENQEKINTHGRRADAIVKGMLQHSRASTGKKELTDINALADEYLRLSYHGLRAKDKSFNATIETHFDETIGNINIIPQDIGRVLLNLFTNAFYAVTEKKKQAGEGYKPTVTLSTKKLNGKIEMRVADNGGGIPQKVLDKIFQPFFTTKPTGQGTGLGLSLAYDIIKSHGGELKVETKEGEGAQFIIQLPVETTIKSV
jgi:signal transduction histidine kinase/coenzyme F420-reducing hydrogenase delta subunit